MSTTPETSVPRRSFTAGHPGWRRHLWRAACLALRGVALAAVAVAALLARTWQTTPSDAAIAARLAEPPLRVVARDNDALQGQPPRLHQPVTVQQVPPALRHALLATEDRRFHDHAGIDPRRLVGAAIATLQGRLQGGSTLTQQLARNLFPDQVGNSRSLTRKLREAAVALKLERAYSKRQLLEMYLNKVPYLHNTTGVGAAARTDFGKPVADLATHEAALLVAMLKGPAHYDPERHADRALARRNLVLAQMVHTGSLDAAAAQAAAAKPLDVNVQRTHTAALTPPVALQLVAWNDAGRSQETVLWGGASAAPAPAVR